MTILLIEDMEEMREMLVQILEDQGHEVFALTEYGPNIKGEIDCLLNEKIDLVICDYNFSDYCTFEHVESIVAPKNLPIILQTSESRSLYKYQVYKGSLMTDLEPMMIRAIEATTPRYLCE